MREERGVGRSKPELNKKQESAYPKVDGVALKT